LLTKQNKLPVFWVSAKTKEGIDDCLIGILDEIQCVKASLNNFFKFDRSISMSDEIELQSEKSLKTKKTSDSSCCGATKPPAKKKTLHGASF
jgi:hypothetical protein